MSADLLVEQVVDPQIVLGAQEPLSQFPDYCESQTTQHGCPAGRGRARLA